MHTTITKERLAAISVALLLAELTLWAVGSSNTVYVGGTANTIKEGYVEGFGDDKESQQLQAMVISALVSTKRFIITENKEKADATLKGVGLEKTSQELHATGEATSVGAAAGGHSGSVSGSEVNRNGSISGS